MRAGSKTKGPTDMAPVSESGDDEYEGKETGKDNVRVGAVPGVR